ncbi:MAG: cytochrome b N-terminal domain-containing protein [Phycisphaeraceae bacterium]|nr:cytochrome b N-terminal domain-containing protein [Phycisphaeraceae bacterium]
MGLLRRIRTWFEDRSGASALIGPVMTHRVPRSAKWWYVFGSATLMFFLIQIATGIMLATLYVPSAAEAYDSLRYIDEEVPFGWMVRAIHGWSSNAMVLMMLVHLSQVFLHGAYKYPRELTWMVGVLLMVCTLALAFTGQVMRFDQDAYWGLGIGASIVDRVPVFGNELRAIMLGGPIIAGATLSRFFALHVFVLPGLTIVLVGLHMMLILRHGISEMPKPGEVVDPATYKPAYEERIHRTGVPFFPDAARRDMVFCGLALLVMLGLAAWFGPFGPGGVPDPTIIDTNPRPDFFFLWIFAALALLPPAVETPLLIIGPPVLLLAMLLIPIMASRGERAPSRRPLVVVLFAVIVTGLVTLSWLGVTSPWSPQMDGWTSAPVPAEFVRGRTPLELQGATMIQFAQCRNCHSLGGLGGERGPALDRVATRLSWDQLVRQVQQGGGNMPAYGKTLTSAQTEAIVAFLATLRPDHVPASEIPGALEVSPGRDQPPMATPDAPEPARGFQ